MKCAPEDIETIENAAALLDGEALMLLHSCAAAPAYENFGEDIGAKECYDAMKQSVAQLYALAGRMRACG